MSFFNGLISRAWSASPPAASPEPPSPGSSDDEDEVGKWRREGKLSEHHPARFEQRTTVDGRIYYTDHHLQITTWVLKHKPRQALRRKVKYVREQVLSEARKFDATPGQREPLCCLSIRRSDIFELSFDRLAKKEPHQLRRRLSVNFIGEDGVDAGGLTREFFHLLSAHISNPNYGLFYARSAAHPDRLSINPQSGVNAAHLSYFRVVGRFIALTLLNGEKVSLGFAGIIWKLLIGGIDDDLAPGSPTQSSSGMRRRRSNEVESHASASGSDPRNKRRRKLDIGIDDLKGVDDELGKSLRWTMENDASVLERTFTCELDDFGQVQSIPLRPGGEQIDVTDANKEAYVREMARFIVLESVRPQTEAMLKGVYEMIPREILATLSPEEMELLVCGVPDISVDDWQQNTVYNGGYSAQSLTVRLFWSFIRTLSQDQLSLLLRFVTGSPRLPHGGFAQLRAHGENLKRFTITWDHNSDPLRLPSAHTCFNQLDLPLYSTWDQMARGITTAIDESSSFALQ